MLPFPTGYCQGRLYPKGARALFKGSRAQGLQARVGLRTDAHRNKENKNFAISDPKLLLIPAKNYATWPSG